MTKIHEVLGFLIPDGGYVAVGDDYEGIQFIDCEPITKEQFEAGFSQYDTWKAEQNAQAEAKRQAAIAKLAALGLEPDDLTALGL